MTSRIVLGATGRPHAQCPACGRVHPILRRGDYLSKPTLRFRCKNPECRASWNANAEERQQIQAYFAARQAPPKTPGKKSDPPPRKKSDGEPENAQTHKKAKKSIWDGLA